MPWPRLIALAAFLGAIVPATVSGAEPTSETLRSPAGSGATAARTTVAASGGRVVLSWVERLSDQSSGLYTAVLAPDATAWSPATAITAGEDLVINTIDAPHVVLGTDRHALAVWLRSTPAGTQAWTAASLDEGLTWGPPQRLTTETDRQEFVSISPLPEGRFMAVWLDGRTGDETALYGRVVGSTEPDALIDDRVCDCCAIALNAFPDGSLIVIYRDRGTDEIRDMAQARWRAHEGWTRETGLPADGWKIAGCPVNGPALSRVGAALGLVWFTAADGDPRVVASTSKAAGRGWSVANRLSGASGAAPVGRPGAALLRNGSLWTSWLEPGGTIALRELRAGGRPDETFYYPVGATGVPQLAVARDVPGKPAQLLLVHEIAGDSPTTSELVTNRLTLPAPTVTLADDCGCNPTDETVRGHALRGEVVSVDAANERLRISHGEIAGFAPAGERDVRVDVRLLDVLGAGQPFLARLEQRDDGDWWLFDVRLLRRR